MIPIDTCVIPLKDRSPYISIESGILDVEDGSFTIRDSRGCRARIPVAGLGCLMLGPGTTITHSAIKLAAEVHCLIMWTGQNGVRLYSSGMPGGSRCDRLLLQASHALDPVKRSRVVRTMYQYRFDEMFSENLSVEQMRGKEAARVKRIYNELAKEYGVEWKGRRYDSHSWNSADIINRCISSATSCLYGLSEAAILIAGYSPSIGFIHTGRQRSFVYDVADMVKYETVVPVAFRIASTGTSNPERDTRIECRDMFSQKRILECLVPLINSLFDGDTCIQYNGVVEPPSFSEGEGAFYDGSFDS